MDIIAVLIQQPNYQAARNYWKVLKNRLKKEGSERVTNCNRLKMVAEDGKMCLDRKLDRITLAFQGAMDDPEDMRQLVIGMASPRMFTEMFADAAPNLEGEKLERWFNSRTATFGGKDSIETVRSLFGNVARFDFGEVADQIPKVDIPDLVPFFKLAFAVLGKRPNQIDAERLTFKTPQEWMDDFTIAEKYELLFARGRRPMDGEDVAGVGLRVVDRALKMAVESPGVLATMGDLSGAIVVFAIRDRITGEEAGGRKVVVAVQQNDRSDWTLLRDWELLKLLSPAADKPRSKVFDVRPKGEVNAKKLLAEAENVINKCTRDLDLPFRVPMVEQLAMLMPGKPDKS